ncbi:class II fructose-bisphosphate aldolase [Enterococcus avium]|uniref:Class II fructose-bisphosphate aldolase n=1 Tax=Enterococcus avium TaxID=33945 RepID=A0ABD5F727_ENTAV|nr:class II fructose-bisphosphate aldolase [Enterococcus avium]MDT2436602.1 class II fructose-bisphosphate aldolase [Enterococcus avium]MDT2466724.1 class II fructose-bisphosphate aldolase [Enterococcus avium]MDT2482185.1 class II fructose-bisphosphate aldolase [Enterococcus avium]MDT2506196.1 class II fructose-bisphosphate aldolase [Enterococcus avium]MDT2508792.1 class II fructose-bisphosphate aldolase [Enterococcus avium]
MLVKMNELLKEAQTKKVGIGAYNVPNLEAVRAVIAAAEELNQPVILAHAQVHEPVIPLSEIGPIMVQYAKQAKVPVSVHLDHGTSFDLCVQALEMGFTSVMFDASDQSFEENVKGTSEMVKIAHALGASVEAELGHVFTSEVGGEAGAEDRVVYNVEDHAGDDMYTDPEAARKFVEQTNVDCLAIAFGTAHGIYLTKPELNLNRVSEIAEVVDIPLVMHGGSGVSKEDMQTAIKNGICKINYFAYMNKSGGEKVKEYITSLGSEIPFFDEIIKKGIEGMKENVVESMKVFSMQ